MSTMFQRLNLHKRTAIGGFLSVITGAAFFAPSNANAVINLTLTPSSAEIGQNNLDCIFLSSTCPNGDLGLNEPAGFGTSQNSYAGTSLTYYLQSGGTAGNTLPFNQFEIQIDSGSSNRNSDTLNSFYVLVNNNIEFAYNPLAATIGNIRGRNGNSNADYQFSPIDLSAFAPGSTVTFQVSMSNLTGSGESLFFFNPSLVSAIPEPAEVAMMMAGLGVIGLITRRRRSKAI
jgi:hypothetical protein